MTFSASSNTNKAQETENVAQLRMHLRLAGWAAEEKTLSEEVGQFCLFISVFSGVCIVNLTREFQIAHLHGGTSLCSPQNFLVTESFFSWY